MQEEAALLAAWKKGDRAAGERVLSAVVPTIRRFFRNKVGSEVDELTQQVVLDCVRSIGRFEGRSSFRTYAIAVARRRLIAFYRGQQRAERQTDIDQMSIAELSASSPSSIVARKQQHTFLLHALCEIPLELQSVIELHYWESLSTAAIADALDLPQGTVKSRLRRAREAVAVALRTLDPLEARVDDVVERFDEWAASLREIVDDS